MFEYSGKKSPLKTYKVYYSGHSGATVKSRSVAGARKKAWTMGAFKYGWTKSDFLRNADVDRIS